MPPHRRPVWDEAFDALLEQWRFARTEHGRFWITSLLQERKGMTLERAKDFALFYEAMLWNADPVYVTAEMCDQLPFNEFEPHPLQPFDLLTETGFVLFEKVLRYDNVDITGFAWAVMPFELEGGPRDGIFFAINSHWNEEWGTPTIPVPRILPMDFATAPFDEVKLPHEFDEHPDQTSWWVPIFEATWAVMREFIAASRQGVQLQRASRREAVRRGFPERDTLVVRLRRTEQHPYEPSGEKANYSHRFPRRAHWRQQPYPSLGVVRPKLIQATVVGDPSLPFKPRNGTIFLLNR